MTEEEKIKFVREKLTAKEMLIRLAEECNELSQACLKLVRNGTQNQFKKWMDTAIEYRQMIDWDKENVKYRKI